MTGTDSQDRNRQFAEDYLRQLARYPDGAALILRTADALRTSAVNGASSAQPTEVPQSNEHLNPQPSTTADGWEF